MIDERSSSLFEESILDGRVKVKGYQQTETRSSKNK